MAHADDSEACPLCLEALDITDLACQFCNCGYSMCLWCWHRIREDATKQSIPARCPNCRTVYRQDRVKMDAIDPDQLEDTRRKNKEERKKAAAIQPKQRRDLANVRVVQRNLVYAVGLAMEICHEETLMGPTYFGAFGKMVRQMSVNRTGPYGSAVAKNGPTGSAYITFKRPEDAKRCIEVVNGVVWGGKQVKACFGTTKYCNAFLKGIVCNNPECLYLHEIAEDTDSYTKEETKSSKFINLTHAASMSRQLSQSNIFGSAATPANSTGRLQGQPSLDQLPSPFTPQMLEHKDSILHSGAAASSADLGTPPWVGSPPGSSWLAKAASMSANASAGCASAPTPATPLLAPAADGEEWPELGGASSMAAPPSVANEQSPATKAASASYDISPRPSPSGLSPAPASKTPPGRGNHSQAARPSSASAQHSQPPATPGQSSPKLLSSSPPQAVCTPQAKGASQAKMVPNTQAKAPQQHSAAEQAFPVLNEAPHTSAALASAQQLKQQQHHQPHLQRHQQLFQPQQAEHQSHLQQQQPQQQQLLHQQPEQQPQLQMSSLGNVQADPVVRLVSHRSSSRAPPPGFAGSIGAPSGQPLQHASHAEGNRRRGPPPGFTTPLAHMNGRPSLATPSCSSSESLSAAMDQQPQAWHPEPPPPQSRPHPWLSQPSEQPASSSPLASYQANAFAMPSLSSGLDRLWSNSGASGNSHGSNEQAAEHSLFSGSSHVLGFPQSQFRQQSRFQFAQELPSGNAVGAGTHPQQVPATPFANSLSVFQQGQQQAPLQQQQQQQLSLFRHDAARSHEAIHPFARPQAAFGYHGFPGQSSNGPGQALLSQLQMPRSLSSSQQAQPDSRQHPPDGRGLNSSLSSMPFFDPVILSATSSSSLDRGAGGAAGPTQMRTQPDTEARNSPPEPARSRAGTANEPAELAETSAGTAATTEPASAHKNGKRRRGGRGTKNGVQRSPQPKGKGRGQNAGNSSSADMTTLQQQYNQARSQLAISGAQLAQAQQNFQNIQI